MRSTITKSEIRQTFREDPVFLWFRQILLERFDTAKLLRGAPTSDRLWAIKGISEVLNFVENPELMIELLDEDLNEE